MNATTANTAYLAAGTYTWERPGVTLAVTVDAAGHAEGTLTTERGIVCDLADLAAPYLLAALAEVPVQFTPAPAPAPVTLTRQRARDMHRELARLGLPADARYTLAAELTGRPVESLTALTEEEARRVWLAACAQAQTAAEQTAAEQTAEEWLGL